MSESLKAFARYKEHSFRSPTQFAQWFWRRRFFNFNHFVIISPWKRAGSFIWRNLNPLLPRMPCAKFGWNWFSGSGEEDFLILSMYFRYFIIISSWKRAGSFFWTKLNSQGCVVPSLVKISSAVLEKKIY